MKGVGDDAKDVEDDELDDNSIEEKSDWKAFEWGDGEHDLFSCSKKTKKNCQVIEDMRERLRIERKLDEPLD